MSSIAPAPSPSPSPSPPSRPAQVLRSPQASATAVTVLLSVGAVFTLLSAWGKLYMWQQLEEVLSDPSGIIHGQIVSHDILINLVGFAESLTMLATTVVFIVWFHRVRCNAEVFRPDGFSQSAGWAIGGWFVPIANLFFPYRTARETWNASTQNAPDGSFRSVSGAPVVTWWLACVAAWLLNGLGSYNYRMAVGAAELRDAYPLAMVADLVIVVAAVLAVLFVRKLTALQGVKAAQGPNAAA
ncbi:DUF4328 domain-containing protein [Streptomyces sp. NBC_01298]|uniref:DUF4328 domain-containing protein n=1 Tax=Streptomyces sp. NBC_01298 TaxID=2903817 RepID=UPI002E161093|nr:DUF4328 domain-containing protein [Streptomyces sp. NBC_01298]